MNYRTSLGTLLALALVSSSTLMTPLARADDGDEPRTISVTGTATVYVVPDSAELRFNIRAFDRDLAKAKTLNDETTATLLAFLKTNGVEDKDLQTFFANTQAIYDQKEENGRWTRGPLQGYDVTKHFKVKLRKLDAFPAILDAMLTNPAVTVESYTFESSKSREHRDEARRKAVRAAQEKAALLASEMAVEVGSPRQISEATMYEGGSNRIVQNAGYMASDSGDGSGATPVGQIELSAQVSVSFDLKVSADAAPATPK